LFVQTLQLSMPSTEKNSSVRLERDQQISPNREIAVNQTCITSSFLRLESTGTTTADSRDQNLHRAACGDEIAHEVREHANQRSLATLVEASKQQCNGVKAEG
jgi:hypothetical protein